MSNIGRIYLANGEACSECGKRPTVEGHDACIGTLPNVMNACCGHGNSEEAYVQFYNLENALKYGEKACDGIERIAGKKAIRYIIDNKIGL